MSNKLSANKQTNVSKELETENTEINSVNKQKKQDNKNFISRDNKETEQGEVSKNQVVKKTVKTMSIEILTILLGTFILALGFQIFLTPHNIVPGGFMGIAKIIYDGIFNLTGFSSISISVWYIFLNVFLYLYAVKCLGWKFGVRAGVGIASYSLFVFLIEQTNLIDIVTVQFEAEAATSYILYAIYGGVLMGSGLGLVFRGNGSTGGSDILAVVVNKFFPTVTTGQIIIIIDGIVVVLSALVYSSLVLPLYALITIFISGKVSDMFVDGTRSLRAYYVVTDKKEEISQEVFEKLNRGVTNLKCEGMFTHNDRDMLLIIVRHSQIIKLKKIVKRVDPNSFMFAHSIKEAYGKGFITYDKEKTKNIKSNMITESNNVKIQKEQNLESESKNSKGSTKKSNK